MGDNLNVNLDGAKFKSNNGIVLRVITNFLSSKWFSGYELKAALASYKLGEYELFSSLDYLSDRECIKVRSLKSKEAMSICDANLEDVEIKLAANGRLIALSLKDDEGIEI